MMFPVTQRQVSRSPAPPAAMATPNPGQEALPTWAGRSGSWKVSDRGDHVPLQREPKHTLKCTAGPGSAASFTRQVISRLAAEAMRAGPVTFNNSIQPHKYC